MSCVLYHNWEKTPGDGCKTARSTYECKTCDVELFVDPCFEVYYTKKDYKQAYQRSQGQNVGSDDFD